jgi:hypothetical protein
VTPVVPIDWDSVMTIGEYLPWVPMDEILVESLELTKAYDTFQSYSRLQLFLLSFPDTFIINNNVKGDRQWQRTWRAGRPRPPDKRVHMVDNNIGVDHQRQTVETLCVMMSILGHGITYISDGDIDPNSHGDEHGGLSTVSTMTQKQLVGIGSDKLPSFPWDLGACPRERDMERDNFSLLIIMIEYGDGWAYITSIEVLLLTQLLDNRSSFHRYSNVRIQEWGIQYVHGERTIMFRVV